MAKTTKSKKTKITFGPVPVYDINSLVGFNTIEDGCNAFGLEPEKRGWIVMAGARFENATIPDPDLQDVTLWFPNAQSAYWTNAIQYSGKTIVEVPTDSSKNQAQVNKYLANPEIRVSFLKDETQWNGYKFIGVYKLNKEETIRLNRCVWEQILKATHSDLSDVKQYKIQNP